MLRWAVLGTGPISTTAVDAIKLSNGSSVDIVAGRDPEHVRNFQNKHQIAKGVTDFDAALNAPYIDAVYIGVPSHKHHELVIKAAQKGKAIWSEKPLTTNMDAAHALAAAVRENNVFFLEGLMCLSHPLYQRLAEIMTECRLGRIRAINAVYAADIWKQANPKGKGTIYNLGCYPVSVMQYVIQNMFGNTEFADRQSVAVGNVELENGNIQDAAIATRFANGTLATLQVSNTYGMTHALSIIGENGALQFKTNPWLPLAGKNIIGWYSHGAPGQVIEPEEIIIDDKYDSFYYQVKAVEDCVAAGLKQAPRPMPQLTDSLEIMSFLTEWETLIKQNNS